MGSPMPPVGPDRGSGEAKPADGKRFSEFEKPLEDDSPLLYIMNL